MGRRSVHTPEELRQLILEGAKTIIERDGLAGLSAREIAKLIGYSAGTLYNMFENLNDILLTLQLELATSLHEELLGVVHQDCTDKYFEDLVRTYVRFTLKNRQVWSLLFAHRLPPGRPSPDVLREKLYDCGTVAREALRPVMSGADDQEIEIASRTLVAGLLGITGIAISEKGPLINDETAETFALQLARTYIRGLKSRASPELTAPLP